MADFDGRDEGPGIGPAAVVSTVLTTTIGALLPGPVTLAVFVLSLAVMMALLEGLGEGPALRLLFGARAHPGRTGGPGARDGDAVPERIGPPAIRLWAQSSAVPFSAEGSRSAKRRCLHRACGLGVHGDGKPVQRYWAATVTRSGITGPAVPSVIGVQALAIASRPAAIADVVALAVGG